MEPSGVIYSYQAVERIPKQLQQGVVYHTAKFKLAALLCACGCGHRVLLLVPDSHEVLSQEGRATIRPSIAVCDGSCKSHYFVTGGEVEWLPAFTAGEVKSLMERQISRHVAEDPKARTLLRRAWCAFVLALARIKKFFK